MKNIWKKYKIYLSILIYLFFIGLVYFLLVRPLLAEIKDKNNKIQEKISDQEIKAEKLAEIPSLRSQFDMINNEEDKINVSFNRESAVMLIEKLEKVSEETGNEIKIELVEEKADIKNPGNSKKTESKEGDNLVSSLPSDNYIKMRIKLSGEYENLLDFIRRLENMEYYSDVISIKATKEQEKISNQAPISSPFEGEDLINEEKTSIEEKNRISSILEVVFYLENK